VSCTAVPAILDPAEISRLIDERAMSWLQWLVVISRALVASVTILMVLALAPLVCPGGTLLTPREWQGA